MKGITNRRVVVTGGAGFLGQAVCEALRDYKPASVFVPRSAQYDLREAADVRRLFQDAQPETVLHLAAVVGGIEANRCNPGRFFYDNAIMGLQLMEEAWREMREGLHREITRLQEDRQTWQDQRACWETEMTGYRAALSDLVRQFDEFQQLRQQDRDTWLEEIHQLQTLIEASAVATRELPVNDAALLGEDTIEPLDG